MYTILIEFFCSNLIFSIPNFNLTFIHFNSNLTYVGIYLKKTNFRIFKLKKNILAKLGKKCKIVKLKISFYYFFTAILERRFAKFYF